MTGIMIGFTRAVHRLGTVYGNGTLTAADTGIYAAGPNGGGSSDSTINLPATPSTNQTITVENTGTGTVTVDGNGNNIGLVSSTTVAPDTMKWFVWGGYTWGFVTGSTCATVTLPDTHDFGTTTQGPAETPYDVPANTVTYSNIGYTPCGGLLRKVITTTYDGRSVPSGLWSWTQTGQCSAGHAATGFTTKLLAMTNYVADLNATGACTGGGDYVYYVYSETQIYYRYLGGSPSDPYTPIGLAFQSVTAYYLDTHIVWTYEIA